MKCPYCGEEMIRGYLMSSRDITFAVEDYLKNGYNEDTAQIEALKEMQKKFSIYFKEVTEDDCV